MLQSKNPRGFVTETFKTGITNPPGFKQLLYNNVDFEASDFEASVQLQIEVKRKMLSRSVTFGLKSVENRFQQQTFFELTTPMAKLS